MMCLLGSRYCYCCIFLNLKEICSDMMLLFYIDDDVSYYLKGINFRGFFFPEISRKKMEFILAFFCGFVGDGNFTGTYFRGYKNKRVRRKGNWE